MFNYFVWVVCGLIIQFDGSFGISSYNDLPGCKADNVKHTVCEYRKINEDKCKNLTDPYYQRGLKDEEKKILLDLHNSYRRQIASGTVDLGIIPQEKKTETNSKASNMNMLVWDNELGDIAQKWADQCTFDGDQCHDVQRFPVGQNYKGRASGSDYWQNPAKSNEFTRALDIAVDAWAHKGDVTDDEINVYLNVTDARLPKMNPYLQLAAAQVTSLGCGLSKFVDPGSYKYKSIIVCNYGPKGLTPMKPVYIIGDPCTKCTDGVCETGQPEGKNALCVPNKVEPSPMVPQDGGGLRCNFPPVCGSPGGLLVSVGGSATDEGVFLCYVQNEHGPAVPLGNVATKTPFP